MVFHVGVNSVNGEVLIFNSENKKTDKYELNTITGDDPETVDILFDQIKLIAGGNLGHACILISDNTKQEMRRKLVSAGKKIGFIDIGLLTFHPALYLQAVVESKYIPKEGDIIWIVVSHFCNRWKIENGKAKHVGKKNVEIDDNETFNIFMTRTNNITIPNVLLYGKNTEYVGSFIKSALQCQRIGFNFDKKKLRNSCLIKARAMAKDPEVAKCDFRNVLYHEHMVQHNYMSKMVISENSVLPVTSTMKIKGRRKENIIRVLCKDEVVEVINLPYVEEYYVVFTIDENELFSIKVIYSLFERDQINVPNDSLVGQSSSLAEVDISPKHFIIPQKRTSYNPEINGTGIDLGTSRCCAAVNRRNAIETVALDNKGERLLPSYVGFDESNVKCGQLVVDRLRYFSKHTVFDSKRIIGRKLDDVVINSNWPFKLLNSGNGLIIEVETEKETSRKYPEQIAMALLKHIKSKTEAFQGQKLTKAVITIPATFSESQQNATRSAGILAGWDVVELLPEPIAAAFAYFIDRPIPNNSTLLLFDLGGGTLDVCVFHIANNEIEILATDGDSQLGGRDFDNILIDYFRERLKKENGIKELGDRQYKLMVDCEKIKEDLTASDKAWLDVDGYDPSQNGLLTITRKEFEKLSEMLLARIKRCVLSALNKINRNANDIDKVFFVGGGSRMQMVQNLLRETFIAAEHCCEEHPDEVVATGAAYYAYHIFSNSNYPKSLENKSAKPRPSKTFNSENPCCFISTQLNANYVDKYAVGVDFGNTTCCVAVNWKNCVETICLDNTGGRLLPSYISYEEDEEMYGQVVIDRLKNHAKSTVYDIKNLIGKSIFDIEIDPTWPFEILEQNNKVHIKVVRRNDEIKELTVEEITASLFKFMKRQAEVFHSTKLTNATITIPFDFTDVQKEALLEAAKLAGWEKVEFIPEPIAAFFAYFAGQPILNNTVLLMFDMGGSTLNVSIIKIQNNQIQFISNTKDSELGCKDFGNALFNYFRSVLITNYGINLREEKKHKLMLECQELKHKLSYFDDANLLIDEIVCNYEECIQISSDQFERLSYYLLNRIKTIVTSTLYNSGYTAEQVNEVLYVGGGSRMPMIKKLIREIFPLAEQRCDSNPDEVVAIGAAYYASHLFFEDFESFRKHLLAQQLPSQDETSSCTSYQRSAKGNVSVKGVSPDGKFIVVWNTHRSKQQDISGWKLKRITEDKHEVVFKFPLSLILNPRHKVRIWACGPNTNNSPESFVFKGVDSFGTGKNAQYILYNPYDEERASLKLPSHTTNYH